MGLGGVGSMTMMIVAVHFPSPRSRTRYGRYHGREAYAEFSAITKVQISQRERG